MSISMHLLQAKRMAMQPPGHPQGSLAQVLPHQVTWHPRPQAYPAAMQPGLQMAGQVRHLRLGNAALCLAWLLVKL